MKQQKLIGYVPNYPKKVVRGAAIAAAAVVVMSGAAGCIRAKLSEPVQTEGLVSIVEPTEEPALQGKILVTELPEEVLVTDGEVAIPELTEEELVLDGEVANCEPASATPSPTSDGRH